MANLLVGRLSKRLNEILSWLCPKLWYKGPHIQSSTVDRKKREWQQDLCICLWITLRHSIMHIVSFYGGALSQLDVPHHALSYFKHCTKISSQPWIFLVELLLWFDTSLYKCQACTSYPLIKGYMVSQRLSVWYKLGQISIDSKGE